MQDKQFAQQQMYPCIVAGESQRATSVLLRPREVVFAIQNQCKVIVALPGIRFDPGQTAEGLLRVLPTLEVGILGSKLVLGGCKLGISPQGCFEFGYGLFVFARSRKFQGPLERLRCVFRDFVLELADGNRFASRLLLRYFGRDRAAKIRNADRLGLALRESACMHHVRAP